MTLAKLQALIKSGNVANDSSLQLQIEKDQILDPSIKLTTPYPTVKSCSNILLTGFYNLHSLRYPFLPFINRWHGICWSFPVEGTPSNHPHYLYYNSLLH
jgi:hypothetical protein